MVDDFAARRWQKVSDPNQHQPIDALKAVIRDIEAGDLKPHHVVIVWCADDGEGDAAGTTGFYQGGKLSGYFGALGLLTRELQIMGGNP